MLLSICVILIVIILAVGFSSLRKRVSKFTVPSITVNHSDKKGCRGIFATQNFNKNAVIEAAPVVELDTTKASALGELHDYVFKHPSEENKVLLVLGYGSLYNHDDNNNITYSYDEASKFFLMTANRDIRAGEELCVTYGEKWWTDRPTMNKM